MTAGKTALIQQGEVMEQVKHTAELEVTAAAQFMTRMLPYLVDGKSFEEAGKAVLDRDRKLMLLTTADNEQGEFIRKHIAAQVYDAVNVELFAERQAMIAKDAAIKDSLASALAKAGA